MPEYENRTRKGLDAALRELLKQKPLDQIRVRELTELCGLRRQSFYYHFEDVYELFRWSIQRERELLLRRQEECLTWRQALLEVWIRGGLALPSEEIASFLEQIINQSTAGAMWQTLWERGEWN